MSVTISGSGQIIKQVVQGTLTTQLSTSSSSYVTTGLSASITPTNASNKILIIVMGDVYNSAGQSVYTTVYRGATELSGNGLGRGFVQSYGGAASIWTPLSISYLDSPATTSATTYTVYTKCAGGTTAWGNDNGGSGTNGTIILMEVAYA